MNHSHYQFHKQFHKPNLKPYQFFHIGEWILNFPLYLEIMTYRPTDRPTTDRPGRMIKM